MRILIADDHELVRRGVRSVLRTRPDIDVCGEAIDGQDAIEQARLLSPDLIVMDISMPTLNGLEATREIRRIFPEIDILILSQHNSPEMMRQALNAGARGYVVKTAISEDLLDGIDKLRRGQLVFDPSVSGAATANVDMQEILQRSQAFERALRGSEERFRLTFEQAAVGVAHISKEGHWLRVNQKLCEIVGYTQEDLRKFTMKEITHLADLAGDLTQSAKVAAGRLDQYSIEKRLICKDGSTVWVNQTVSAVRDSDSRLDYLVCVVEDVTQRKRAEFALADAARHQKALFHLADHLHRATSADEIFSAAIEAILGALQCDRASILRFDEQDKIRFVSWCGLSAAYRAATDGHSPWRRDEQNPQPITISDIETADLEPALKATVKAEGIGALAFVPLVSDGNLIGKFMAYFNAPHVFPESDVELSLTIARQLAFALERQRAEDDLRQSEERFRAIVETTPECVKLVGSDGTLLHMNAAGVAMVGADSAQTVVGKNVYDLIAPEDRDRFRAFNEKICRGEKGSLEFEISGLLGKRRQMETYAVPLRQPNGRVVQLGISRDITVRNRAEHATNLLAAIVDSSDDAIISKNLDGVITSWNRGAERIFGYTAEEAIGQHITLIIPPDRRDEERDILARLKRGERVDHFETVRVRKDRTLLDISLTISPVKDAAGCVVGASKVARDITERRQVEQALAERALLLDLSNDAILVRDGADRVTYWNKSASELYGYSREEALGRMSHELLHTEFPEPLHRITEQLHSDSRWTGELIHRRKDGNEIVVMSRWVLNRDDRGNRKCVLETNNDITQQKQSEKALRESENRLRTLTDTLETQVRIRTEQLVQRNAEVLKQSEQLRDLSHRMMQIQDEERRHIARELHDSAGQLLTVLAMDLSTLVRNAQEIAPEIAESAEEARELVHQLTSEIRTTSYLLHPPLLDEEGLQAAISWYIRGLIERSGLDITFNISERFGRLPREMELAVFRLVQECLTNIHRHSGSKRALIEISRTSEQILLEVRDEGKGISREKLAEIQSRGAGVGIRGMRERVRQFKGEMTIESSGLGTSFRVTIPAQARNDVAIEETKIQTASGR